MEPGDARKTEERPDSPREAARHLAQVLPELARIADRAGLPLLAYLIEMARLQADEDLARVNEGRVQPSSSETR